MNGKNYPDRNIQHSISENNFSPMYQFTNQFEDMNIVSSKHQIESNMQKYSDTINNKSPYRFNQSINNLNVNQPINKSNINSQKSDLNAPEQINQFSRYQNQMFIKPIYDGNPNIPSACTSTEISNKSPSLSNPNQRQIESKFDPSIQSSIIYNHPKNFPDLINNQLVNSNQSLNQTIPTTQSLNFNPPPLTSINSTSTLPPYQNTSVLNSSSKIYYSAFESNNRTPFTRADQYPLQDISKSKSSTPVFSNVVAQSFVPSIVQNQQYPSNLQMPSSIKPSQDLMPNPIAIMEEDKRLRSTPFHTNIRGQVPPLVTTDFIVHDEGISSPKYLRSTIYNVPCQYEMLKQSYLPFALIISPFSKLKDQEMPPPISDLGGFGPTRCNRCKAYMCPYMKFSDNGKKFQCAFCDGYTEVPQEYFAYLDNMGQRTDKFQRPELCLGSYEFIATAEYCKNQKFPNPPAFIFLIDVSYNNIKNGIVTLLCQNMKSLLKELPKEGDADISAIRIGFVTYSDVVHFYNIKGKLSQPQMLTVSDIEDMFVPLIDGFFVSVEEAETLIESLMEQIPIIFADSKQTEVVLGPAIQAGLEALKAADCCGKLFVFHSTLPIAEAPGRLKNREDRGLLGNEKEKMILNPQIPYYTKLGEDCVAAGCSVDLFLFPNSYIDIATIGEVCRLTGGNIYKYSYFQVNINGEKFLNDLKSVITQSTVFDAVMRVRTSAGIRATDFYGNFYMANTTDLEIASLDNTKSITAEIKYDDRLQEGFGTYIQVATLYTSCSGQRRIRINNLNLNTCSQIINVFQGTSGDAIIHFFLKRALKVLSEESPQQVKQSIKFSLASILAAYKKNYSSQTSFSQLILPDNLQLLPLYVNCLLKSDAISGGPDISSDDRSLEMLNVNCMDLYGTVGYLYPRLISLTDLDKISSDTLLLRCSASNIMENGTYLLENGVFMFIWIGRAVNKKWIQDVFGVHDIAEINTEVPVIPELNTPISQSIRSLIEKIRKERKKYLQLFIIRQGDKLEMIFRKFLVEDNGIRGISYTEYMNLLQKEISELTK